MTTNIKPLHDRVIVKRIEESEQVRGGIIIPDSAKEKPQEGEVIAVGEGKYRKDGSRQALDVQVGDRVLFGKYSSSEIKIDHESVLGCGPLSECTKTVASGPEDLSMR